MSDKHIFFYHPQCNHCNALLGKVQGTQLQKEFLYINITDSNHLPKNLKGVPAILPRFQTEAGLLQGQNAFVWINSIIQPAQSHYTQTTQNPRTQSQQQPQQQSQTTQQYHPQTQNHSPHVTQQQDTFIGTSTLETGGQGFSDKYSFLSSDSAMPHRYSYVGNNPSHMKAGSNTTGIPNGSLKDAHGVSAKQKQFESDLKRLQSSRDEIPNGIRRIG
jgi:hypothetical protein